jgi:hypothetical protein
LPGIGTSNTAWDGAPFTARHTAPGPYKPVILNNALQKNQKVPVHMVELNSFLTCPRQGPPVMKKLGPRTNVHRTVYDCA